MSREHRGPIWGFVAVSLACVLAISHTFAPRPQQQESRPKAVLVGGLDIVATITPVLPGVVIAPVGSAWGNPTAITGDPDGVDDPDELVAGEAEHSSGGEHPATRPGGATHDTGAGPAESGVGAGDGDGKPATGDPHSSPDRPESSQAEPSPSAPPRPVPTMPTPTPTPTPTATPEKPNKPNTPEPKSPNKPDTPEPRNSDAPAPPEHAQHNVPPGVNPGRDAAGQAGGR
ncbi:hypothetical protein [Nocardioides limicola]|uniref:hypothetical protein n=1 Tax=Nocardioides limicola TaxID=2803368 RepID=UPI00193BCCD1|nr:hypothetical protein [Nocardioides sp. DJM-14]